MLQHGRYSVDELTSDLQIASSGLNKAISPTTGQLTGIDTAVVAGARLRVRF
jgi:hypothetical protein